MFTLRQGEPCSTGAVTGLSPRLPHRATQWTGSTSHTQRMDPEIRRLFMETLEALEAVLVTMQLEVDADDPERMQYDKVEELRRVVQLRRVLESQLDGQEG